MLKPAFSYLTDIFRHSDIDTNQFVVFNLTGSTKQIIFGTQDGWRLVYSFNFSEQILYTGFQQNQFYVAVNTNPVTGYIYHCVRCIYHLQLPNFTDFSQITTFINFSVPATHSFRIYQGFQNTNNDLMMGGKIYWAYNAGGISKKLIINKTNSIIIQSISTPQIHSIANHKMLLSFGTTSKISYNDFLVDLKQFTQNEYGQYIGKLYITDPSIYDINGTMIALHLTYDAPWRIYQYQLVNSCNDYNASVNITTNSTIFCTCFQYNSINLCNSVSNQITTGKNFPIALVIAVIAAIGILYIYVVVTIVSIIIIKKKCKRCIKGRGRTPWKYNPVQLMSFQS